MRGLKDKVAIVVGTSPGGMGAAAAIRLAEEGAKVVVGDLNMVGAEATTKAISDLGGTAIAVQFDLQDDASVARLVKTAVTEFGRVDLLDNSAADLSLDFLARDTDVLRTDLEVWERAINTNLLGFVRTIRHTLPIMLERGAGKIVNVSSLAAVASGNLVVAYSATKGGVNTLTRHVAATYGKQGIRCNGVMPGMVRSAGNLLMIPEEPTPGAPYGSQRELLESLPVERLGVPADVANVVTFLLSSEADWINGQTWAVDGGANMRA